VPLMQHSPGIAMVDTLQDEGVKPFDHPRFLIDFGLPRAYPCPPYRECDPRDSREAMLITTDSGFRTQCSDLLPKCF
jgi:hypothetical protein